MVAAPVIAPVTLGVNVTLKVHFPLLNASFSGRRSCASALLCIEITLVTWSSLASG